MKFIRNCVVTTFAFYARVNKTKQKYMYIATVTGIYILKRTLVTKSWHDFHKNEKINWE